MGQNTALSRLTPSLLDGLVPAALAPAMLVFQLFEGRPPVGEIGGKE